MMQHTATHTATQTKGGTSLLDEFRNTHCNTLQHTATHTATQTKGGTSLLDQICNAALQNTATHCNTLCVAVCCSVLQCVAVRCNETRQAGSCRPWSVLQCVAVCCSVLQCVAVCVPKLVKQARAALGLCCSCNTDQRRHTPACGDVNDALQHTLQQTPQHTLQHTLPHKPRVASAYEKMQKKTAQHTTTQTKDSQERASRVSSHCNTLQHTAAHCNTLQHTATHTVTHTATHTKGSQSLLVELRAAPKIITEESLYLLQESLYLLTRKRVPQAIPFRDWSFVCSSDRIASGTVHISREICIHIFIHTSHFVIGPSFVALIGSLVVL